MTGLASACLAAGLPSLDSGAAAAETKAAPRSATSTSPPSADVASKTRVVYRPPARGKPRSRVGGAVRGGGSSLPTPRALVPDHVGLTISRQPPLFWFLGAAPPANARVIFTLLDEAGIEPLVESILATPSRAGIQRFDLADERVELEAGREYEWSVAVVDSEQRGPGDTITSGWVLRIEVPDGLPAGADVRTLAAQGLWYDALAAASVATDGDDSLARDALLEQVGLSFAVGAETVSVRRAAP